MLRIKFKRIVVIPKLWVFLKIYNKFNIELNTVHFIYVYIYIHRGGVTYWDTEKNPGGLEAKRAC